MNNQNPKIFFNHFRNIEKETPQYKAFREKIITDPEKQCYFWVYIDSITQPYLCVYNDFIKKLGIYNPIKEMIEYTVDYDESYCEFYKNVAKLLNASNIVPGFNITSQDFYFYIVNPSHDHEIDNILRFYIVFDKKTNQVKYIVKGDIKEENELEKESIWKFIFNNFDFQYSFNYNSEKWVSDQSIVVEKVGLTFDIKVSGYHRYDEGDQPPKSKIFSERSYLLMDKIKTFTLFTTNRNITNQYFKYITSMMNRLLNSSKNEWYQHAEIMIQEIEQDIPFKDWSILK